MRRHAWASWAGMGGISSGLVVRHSGFPEGNIVRLGLFPRLIFYWLLCCTVCGCRVCTSHLVDLLVCLQRGRAAIISWV